MSVDWEAREDAQEALSAIEGPVTLTLYPALWSKLLEACGCTDWFPFEHLLEVVEDGPSMD